MPIDHIRLSQQAKDQLLRLKRRTGLQHWNVLCRWAFLTSLAEPSIPPLTKILADSSVELTWRVFGGTYSEIYLALLRQRCHHDKLDLSDEVLATQFRLHLHRGIGYLAADRKISKIDGLFKRLPLSVSIEHTS